MHFLATVSNNPAILFRLEILLRTLKANARTDFHFTTVLTGASDDRNAPLESIPAYFTPSGFLKNHSEFCFCPSHYSLHPPCRWFVEPKSDICVLIDADILCCSSLLELETFSLDRVRGVTAFSNPISEENWKKIGNWSSIDRSLYFNYGLIIVPSQFLKPIGLCLRELISEVDSKIPYDVSRYAGQIALTLAMSSLGIPREAIPFRFNFYDCLEVKQHIEEFRELVFYHYFSNQNSVTSAKSIGHLEDDPKTFSRAFLSRVIRQAFRQTSGESIV
jgi:hypothetical protein